MAPFVALVVPFVVPAPPASGPRPLSGVACATYRGAMSASTPSASTPKASKPGAPASARGRTRRRPDPARRQLALAVVAVVLGSFMPWIQTSAGNVLGGQGPGLWTFYAAMLGLAGVLIPARVPRIIQAGILAVVALALPLWQVGHVLSLVGTSGWMPGPGLVIVVGGGLLAASATWKAVTARPAGPKD